MTDRLLDVRGLSVRYGPVTAVDDVSLYVDDGSVVGLIGPNGAGKTTFIDAITGFTPVSAGTINFAGREVERLRVHQRARLGLTRSFQSLELFEDLSVRENLLVGTRPSRWWDPLSDAVRPSRARVAPEVDVALHVTGLAADADRRPGELSHGRRRTLGLARALAARPRLVLLDEPAAGLDPGETGELGVLLRRLPARGTTVFLIDHDMGLVMSACDVVWVLDFGRIIAVGPPADIRRHPDVITAYLGQTGAGAAGQPSNPMDASRSDGPNRVEA